MTINVEIEKQLYVPGERIQGTVQVITNERLKHKGIRLFISGIEHVRWSTGSGKNRTTHTATTKLIEETITLFGPTKEQRSNAEAQYLEPGTHTFPFSYPLPDNIPSSIALGSGAENRLLYYVKAYVDKPFAFDISSKKVFFVHQHIPRPFLEPFANSSRLTNRKTFTKFCCMLCCFQTPPLEATIEVPKRLYAPGDVVAARVVLDNNTDFEIETVRLQLKLLIHLRAGSRTHSIVTTRVTGLNCLPNLTRDRSVELQPTIEIPKDLGYVTSTLEKNQCLNVSYFLVAWIDTKDSCHSALQVEVPIIVSFACCSTMLHPVYDPAFYPQSISDAETLPAETAGEPEKSDWS